MITTDLSKKEWQDFAPERFGFPADSLFFDIETTGLSPYQSGLYMIGVLYREDGVMRSRQWLAESFSDEQAVLRTFFDFSVSYSALISYNGDGFDLGFLEECAREYRLPCPLHKKQSFDLYKTVRKLKKVLELTSFRQKSVEALLGISREDPFSGSELIEVYERYEKKHDDRDLKILLLHNLNDLEGLLSISALYEMYRFLEAPAFANPVSVRESGPDLVFSAVLPVSFPVPVHYQFFSGNELMIRDCMAELTVRVLRASLKHFFSDWRNYSFLPFEGYAVHNKLAEFVDKTRKVKATRETAYTVETGDFLPAIGGEDPIPVFQKEYRGKERFLRTASVDPASYLAGHLHALL